jgi:type I restriction enzyme, S subunit
LRLSDVCDAIVDCEHKTAPVGDGFALSVGTRAMKDGQLVLEACKPVGEKTYVNWTRRMSPQAGDLILAREAPVGQVIRVPGYPRVCLGQRTVLIRPNAARVHPRFLHYWLLGPDAQGMMAAQAAGATVPHLNVEDIRNLDVSRMPEKPHEQEAAAAVLGAIDDLLENNRRRVEVLEEIARAIYREWFVYFRFPGHETANFVETATGRVPESWDMVRIGSLGRVITGSTPSPNEPSYWASSGDVPFLTPTDMTMHRVWAKPARFLSLAGAESVRSRILPPGAICFTCIGATIGKIAMTGEPTVTNQQINSIVIDESVSSTAFLFHYLSDNVQAIRSRASGAATPIVNKSIFSAISLLAPPKSIAHEFARIIDPLHWYVFLQEQTNVELGAIRDMLLPRLITGQIDLSSLDLDVLFEDSVA